MKNDIYTQVDFNQNKNIMFSYVSSIFFDNDIYLFLFPTIFIVIYMFITFPFCCLKSILISRSK